MKGRSVSSLPPYLNGWERRCLKLFRRYGPRWPDIHHPKPAPVKPRAAKQEGRR